MHNTNNKLQIWGSVFALLAALFNGTVGVISVNLFNSGLPPESVAFSKCFLALSVVGIFLLLTGKVKKLIAYLAIKWNLVAACSFFGFFVLYHFETAAYASVNVAVVVFCLFGSSTMTTFFLNCLIEKRWLKNYEIISIILAIYGLFFILLDNNIGNATTSGLISAITAGVGYGFFLVMTKYFKIGEGMITIFSLLLFGLLFLFVPFIKNGAILPSSNDLPYLLLLAILPTIGGFWCTTKALIILKSQSVQLIELTEPLFAIVFGFIFLGQLTNKYQIGGGGLIIFSIVVHGLFFHQEQPKKANIPNITNT